MRILWIAQIPFDGAASVSVTTQLCVADRLRDRGNVVQLVLGKANKGSSAPGVITWPLASKMDRLGFQLRALHTLMFGDYDVAILHQEFQVHGAALASLIRPSLRSRLVMDVRTLPIHAKMTVPERIRWWRFSSACRAAARHLGGIVVITQAMADYLVAHCGVPRKSILGSWPSGCDRNAGSAGNCSLPSNGRVAERPIGVYLGVLAHGRGLEALVEAANSPEFPGSVVILGSGPIEQELQAMNSAAGGRVVFGGRLEQPKALSAASKCDYGICLLPQHDWWRVSSPLKLAEYVACSLPIIASDIPACREALSGYGACEFVESFHAGELTRAVKAIGAHVVREDERERVLARHEWGAVAAALEGLLKLATRERVNGGVQE